MTYEKILQEREALYETLLAYYEEKSKEDPRYTKTCEKLKAGKAEFMTGRTAVQVIRGFNLWCFIELIFIIELILIYWYNGGGDQWRKI